MSPKITLQSLKNSFFSVKCVLFILTFSFLCHFSFNILHIIHYITKTSTHKHAQNEGGKEKVSFFHWKSTFYCYVMPRLHSCQHELKPALNDINIAFMRLWSLLYAYMTPVLWRSTDKEMLKCILVCHKRLYYIASPVMFKKLCKIWTKMDLNFMIHLIQSNFMTVVGLLIIKFYFIYSNTRKRKQKGGTE